MFDAMGRVYACRVDEFLNVGNKLIKEFVAEQKRTKKNEDGRNEIMLKPKRVMF